MQNLHGAGWVGGEGCTHADVKVGRGAGTYPDFELNFKEGLILDLEMRCTPRGHNKGVRSPLFFFSLFLWCGNV